MKKVTKFFMAAFLAGMCSFGYSQHFCDPPKANEKVLEILSLDKSTYYQGKKVGESNLGLALDWYASMLETAKSKYPNKVVDIRDMKLGRSWCAEYPNYFNGPAVGKVVYTPDPEAQTKEDLSQALNKALRNVREGSRLAIDQVTVISSMDRGEFKDQLIDVLLDKGYKVVAKEYLEKLYEEQQAQQSGIYNERTTVQENNFSAVGYYINVKVTETSVRVQVVNVSTGEYEGNATVEF